MTGKILQIINVPDPVLTQEAQSVEKIDDTIQQQIDNMLETMYDAPGIGLAANQVGLLNRIFVVDLEGGRDEGPRDPTCLINPEILWLSEERSVMEEGCLSIPGVYADVERPARVRMGYTDRDGNTQEIEADGLLSHCLQHELDHLNGVLYIDYLSKLKRNMMIKKVKKLTS